MSATETTENPDQASADNAQAEWDSLVAERLAPGSAQAAPESAEPVSHNAAPIEAPAAAAPPAAPTMDQLLAQMQELSNTVKRSEGRVSSLQSELARQRNAQPATPETQPSTDQVALAIEDPEEWKKLQDEFPEWGVAIQKKLDATTKAMLSRYGATTAGVKQDVLDAAVSQALESREYARLERAHPGWKALTATPAYQDWYKAQPADVQALADSPHSDDAIVFFDKFKVDTGGAPTNSAASLQQRRQAVLAASATTTPRRPAAPRTVSDQDLTPAEIWQQELARRAKR